MKKVLTILATTILVLIMTTCSNDFELNAPGRDIPVVYGFLSSQDTAHFIRIERAFLPDNQSAFEVAQNPDSVYYQNLDVRLEELDQSNNVVNTFTLEEVNGTDIGFPRESGIFVDDPNILYRFETISPDTLIGGVTYRLVINRGDNREEVTASEVMTSPVGRFTAPREPTSLNIIYGTDPVRPIVTWRRAEDTKVFDLNIRYHIQEWNLNDPTNKTMKTIEGTLQREVDVSSNSISVSADFEPAIFYTILGNELEANPDIRRRLVNYDFVAVGVGSEYERFIEVGRANTGLTSAQLINRYSNVQGGVGLLTSRTTGVYAGFTLKAQSKDSLRNGVITRDLNFE